MAHSTGIILGNAKKKYEKQKEFIFQEEKVQMRYIIQTMSY